MGDRSAAAAHCYSLASDGPVSRYRGVRRTASLGCRGDGDDAAPGQPGRAVLARDARATRSAPGQQPAAGCGGRSSRPGARRPAARPVAGRALRATRQPSHPVSDPGRDRGVRAVGDHGAGALARNPIARRDGERRETRSAWLYRRGAGGSVPGPCSRSPAAVVVPARGGGRVGDGAQLGDSLARALRARGWTGGEGHRPASGSMPRSCMYRFR